MGLLAGFAPAGFSEWHRGPARPLRMLTMVMNRDAFRPVGDPWCRLPGVECCFALRRTPDGALCCSSQPFHLFTAPRCGLQTGPTPYIALANECTWAQALSAPKGLPAPCQQCTAPPCARCSLARSASLLAAHSLEKCRWSAAGADSTPPCLAISW